MKSLKRRILTSFVMIMIVMSSLVSYKVFAKTVPESHIEYEPYTKKTEINYNKLISTPEILCTEKGVYLPSENDKTMASEVDKNGKPIGDRIDTTVLGDNEATYKTLLGKHYKTKENVYYATFTTVTCTPKSAYILNYINENKGGYPTKVQTAWWAVKPDKMGSTIADNDLSKEAKAYQNFVKKIAKNKSDVNDPGTYKTLKHTYENGKEVKIKFPEVDADSSFSLDTSEMKVNFDGTEQKYVIGPLNLKYAEGNYGNTDFGYVDSFDIYTDANTEPLAKNQWEFVFTNKHDSTKDYPEGSGKDPFYIKMDYIPDATKITGIDIGYKYLVVGGKYQTLSGTYDEYEWTCKKIPVVKTDALGNTYTDYEYKLTAKDQELARKSQTLVLANNAARWYESKKISMGIHKGKLIIQKVAYDENGNIMNEDEIKEKFGKDQHFDFKVKIKYADGREEQYTTTVKAGTSEIVGEFYWKVGEDAPTYEVQEVEPSDETWNFVSIGDDNSGTVDGKTVTGKLKNKGNVIVIAENKCKFPKEGIIHIDKKINGVADHDMKFEFEVKVNGETKIGQIIIPKGQETASTDVGPFKWYGKDNPTFEIEELPTTDSEKYNAYIEPRRGILTTEGTSSSIMLPVNVYNTPVDGKCSQLVIEKNLVNGQVTDQEFKFHVHIENVKNSPNGMLDEIVMIKSGERWSTDKLFWQNDELNPSFEITELDSNEVKGVSIDDVTGALDVQKSGKTVKGNLLPVGAGIAEIKVTNDMTPHSGKIVLNKKFTSTEKMSDEELKKEIDKLDKNVKFDVKVVISGTFEYEGQKYINDQKVINKTFEKDHWIINDIGEIKWWGDTVPTFTVTELRSQEVNWQCVGMDYSYVENHSTDTGGHELKDGDTVNVTITNKIPSGTEVDLTFEMAGIVWVDKTLDAKNNEANGYYNKPNGVYDEGEMLKAGTEVWVYKVIYDKNGNIVSRAPAKAYKDAQNNELTFPIVTQTDGAWNVPRIPVPGISKEEIKAGYTADYDVEFVYDGQTYEPTEFLSYKVSKDEKDGYDKVKYQDENGNQKVKYVNADTSVNEYINGSKTIKKEYQNDSMAIETSNANKKIAKISGKNEINANGDTTGIATLTDGKEVEITYSSDDAGTGYPTHSKLNTTDSNGNVLDIFKASATTLAGNLTFPFDVDGYDRSSLSSIDCKFTPQGFESKYKFSAVYNYCLHINLGLKEREDVDIGLTKNLDNAKVVVNEKMYQYNYTGYFDLTEEKTNSLQQDVYVQNATSQTDYSLGLYRSDYYYRAEMYANNQELYNAIKNLDTEMDIYLTYKIKVKNSSANYKVKVDSIDDYYEKNLELVQEPVNKYLKTQTIAGQENDVNDWVTIENASAYADQWNLVKEGMIGSDNVIYNKMTANGLGIELAPGASKEIYLTYKVSKSKDNKFGIEDSIVLGEKCNVAEIASYSSFDLNGYNAGKIDRDSAPSNINLSSYNEKPWYEDDTFAAPKVNINLLENFDRTIDGVVWEDDSSSENKTENPGYNQTVGNGQLDSGESPIEGLKTELLEKVYVKVGDNQYKEYEYLWPTSEKLDCLNGKTIEEVFGLNTTMETDKEGKYTFQNAIAGDYVVRFTYGDKKIDSNTNYSTAKVYNGQDFKSSKFNADLKTGTTLQADSYLNIDAIHDYAEEKNTAIDSEARRLEVVANSREITYANSSEMANYNGDGLYKKYWMYSETPKIDMNIEPSAKYYNGENNNATGYSYEVNHINFGLEERPITQLTLDKQIEEIILTTSDGTNIMDAKYNIEYRVDEKGEIKVDVTLDTSKSYGIDNLQSLNRDEATNQGFRYISVDSSILEGTTITVKYKFTVLNTGEVDRTGELANMQYIEDATQISSAYTDLTSKLEQFTKEGSNLKNETRLGKYVGDIYYYGANCDTNKDAIVTSRVRQLVDYIDNDVEFSGVLNATENMSWSSVTVDELKPYIDENIISSDNQILDEDDVSYNSILMSIDNSNTESTLNNGGFIVDLQPYEVGQINYQASMYLTTTKYIGSDSDDLQIDNISEIIKYNNKVGRRDELTIAGNQNPAEALQTKTPPVTTPIPTSVSYTLKYERDTSATENITLSPPFGSSLMVRRLQIVASIAAGLVILAGGIIVIKRKVLK